MFAELCYSIYELQLHQEVVEPDLVSRVGERYLPIHYLLQSWVDTVSQRITVFLHENITFRLEFHNDFRYFGTQIPNIFYLIQNSSTFFSAAVLVVLKIQDVNLKIKI